MLSTKMTGWLRQPSTIMGIATLIGTGSAVLGQVLTHQQTVAGGVGLFVFAVTHLLISDNTALPSAMEKLVTDAGSALLQKRLRDAFPELEADAAGVVAAAEAPAPGAAGATGAVAKMLGVAALFAVLAPVLMLGACSTAQQQAAVTKGTAVAQRVVADGQLFCAKATADGPLVVALATALGAPVIVTGATSASVAAACAAIDAIPVSPPANAATAPVVAANVSVVPAS